MKVDEDERSTGGYVNVIGWRNLNFFRICKIVFDFGIDKKE